MTDTAELFGKEKISKVLLKLAPPVMLAQLIQALYNIIDSLFVGKYSGSGLTALSIVYPLQLLMIALAVGTGVGINTVMAARLGAGKTKEADEYAGVGTPLAVVLWVVFAALMWLFMPAYAEMSTSSPDVIADVISYGRIVCVFSFGLFLESVWTKVHQANGGMKVPMAAQIAGAVTNIILDPLLIFGYLGLPEMGISGAAVATVAGQVVAALIVMKGGLRRAPELKKFPGHIRTIFRLGMPNILMQAAYTLYIFGLNLILATFSDQAVTVLGLYYKWQTFFFIPLGSMQTCIVPVISYNYAARNIDRCKKTLWTSVIFGMALMFLGTLCFEFIPEQMLRVFSSDELVVSIGIPAFRIIGISFIPLVTSLTFPVFFQAVGSSVKSSMLTVVRTVVLFVPLAFLFSRFGLDWFWLTYPVTDTITSLVGLIFYRRFLKHPYVAGSRAQESEEALKPSRPGVIVTISREHGSGGKQVGRLLSEKLGIPFYYKEMTALAAKESGLDKEFISDLNRNSPDGMHDLYLSTKPVQHAVAAQNKVIRMIAGNGSCVIVGRAADYVLRDDPDVVRVFIYAPEEFRTAKVMEVYGDSREQAQKNIRRSDEARGAYYRSISGGDWGDHRNYDLMVDSSIGAEETAQIIADYVRMREHRKNNRRYKIMKLASALSERSDIQRRLSELSDRLSNNAKVQEGDTPSEDPQALLAEMDSMISRLEELIFRINMTNSKCSIDGVTMTQMLARRDCMQKRLAMLRGFLDCASSRVERYSRSEIAIHSTVDVAALQKQVDSLAAELRRTDEKIQELNWTTELL